MPSLIDYSPAALRSLLRPSTDGRRAKLSGSGAGAGGALGLFKMFKLLPMLTTGCKMAAMLGRHNGRALLADHAPTVTLFGHRRGRLSLAIHEDTRAPPAFLIELPMLAPALHREMATGTVKLALESDTRGVAAAARRRRPLLEEYVWAVYCNGRSAGYAIRRKDASDDEGHVLRLLRGVSMGAGVLPPPPDGRAGAGATPNAAASPDGELTYMRARVERVVGSRDSEAFYMINPDDGGDNHASRGGDRAPELSIFFVRNK
ncbi:Protein MIZU-KUSSEI 1 [Dichanthelium oligosanthes]|uniref:Protein MIZU-KUSSEI 1 n=1 Tax=Dichanthelium oligosanthes TaxID=888268 RepID=A0A1E5WEB9_9POAL|nr:Protein MIZU-KUSSEI 1 [Dichanthelium oligosanthes]